jgi:hypothetical protein
VLGKETEDIIKKCNLSSSFYFGTVVCARDGLAIETLGSLFGLGGATRVAVIFKAVLAL